jgi:predicted enzyme related to lactoylglutathione lyase
MTTNTRFAHTNLVAKDWRKLARFYEQVFGCTPVPPERDLSGQWLDDAVGIPSVHISEEEQSASLRIRADRPGFGHIAFAVDDVEATRQAVLAAGGGELGKVASVKVSGAGSITFAYLTDPEGNIVEVQRWGKNG